jgi:hypothetical protein
LNNNNVTHSATSPNIAKSATSIIDAFTVNFLSTLLELWRYVVTI